MEEFVKKLAKSAKFEYTDEDIQDWSTNMKGIFAWFDKLEEVDTSGVPETPKPAAQHANEDTPVFSPDRDAVVAAFPAALDNMIKVKKVL